MATEIVSVAEKELKSSVTIGKRLRNLLMPAAEGALTGSSSGGGKGAIAGAAAPLLNQAGLKNVNPEHVSSFLNLVQGFNKGGGSNNNGSTATTSTVLPPQNKVVLQRQQPSSSPAMILPSLASTSQQQQQQIPPSMLSTINNLKHFSKAVDSLNLNPTPNTITSSRIHKPNSHHKWLLIILLVSVVVIALAIIGVLVYVFYERHKHETEKTET